MRAELKAQKQLEYQQQIAKIGDQAYETITKEILLLEECGLKLAPEKSYPDPYLFSHIYAANEDKPSLSRQEIDKLENYLADEGVDSQIDFMLGWPLGYQGLSEEITSNPEDWVNLLTIIESTYLFEMYEGYLPMNITILIKQKDLKNLDFGNALVFQDWD